jgi:PKD repeat protein
MKKFLLFLLLLGCQFLQAQLSISLSTTNVTCNGAANGTITTSVTGWIPSNYDWMDLPGTNNPQNRTGLSPGTYTVVASDAAGVTASQTATIIQPNPILTNSSVQNINCGGQNNGAITLTTFGPSPTQYTFDWADIPGVSNTKNRTNLSAGNYAITVTDLVNNCTNLGNYTVTQPTPISINSSQTNISCFGTSNGTITPIASGGNSSNYFYDWFDVQGGNNTANRSNLPAGTYTLTVLDGNQCTKTEVYTIAQPATALTGTIVTNYNVSCFGNTDGYIDLTVSGGTPPYITDWNDLPGSFDTEDRTGLGAGFYTVFLKDANQCNTYKDILIGNPPAIVISQSLTPVTCFGGNNGSINLSVTGGSGSFSYDWADLSGTNNPQNRTGLSIGDYTVTVKDANQCSKTITLNVTQPNQLIPNIVAIQNLQCFGQSTGSITLNPTGSTSPYSYDWADLPLATNPINRSNLSAGTYWVTVSDNINGCTQSRNFVLTSPPEIVVSDAIIGNLCFGGSTGSISLTASGGFGPFNYDWLDVPGTNNSNVNTNLVAGSYAVVITDANNCTVSQYYNVFQPPAISLSILSKTDATCGNANGSATVQASGGAGSLSFLWSNGQTGPTATNLLTGIYTVVAKDANFCTSNLQVQINQTSSLALSSSYTIPVLCNGQSTGLISMIASGGTPPYSYLWTNGATTSTISNIAAGTYSITASDAGGCQQVSSYTLPQATAMQSNFLIQSIRCFGDNTGAAIANITGGVPPYSLLWQNGSTNATLGSLSAGSYQLTVHDANGCTLTDAAILTQPNQLNVNLTSTDITCAGQSTGSAQVTVSGGVGTYNYKWSNGSNSNSVSNLQEGLISVTVYDGNGCQKVLSTTISTPPPIIFIYPVTQNVTCFGGNNGSASINPLGGNPPYSITWNNGQTGVTAQNLGVGVYTAYLTDANGCTSQTTASVNQPTALGIYELNHQDIDCIQGTYGKSTMRPVDGTPPYQYHWSTGDTSVTIYNKPEGDYQFFVTDANGCTTSATTHIYRNGNLIIPGFWNTPSTCTDSTGTLLPQNIIGGFPPFQYQWSNGQTAPTIEVLPGQYSVTVKDAVGCSNTAQTTLNYVTDILNFSLISTNPTCGNTNDGSVQVFIFGGQAPHNIAWSNGMTGTPLTDLSSGVYTATVTDATGCAMRQTAQALVAPPLLVLDLDVNEVSAVGATDGSISLSQTSGGMPPYQITPALPLLNIGAGTYTFTMTDASNCQITETVSILGTAPIPAISVSDSSTCAPVTVQFFNQSMGNPTSWNWQFIGQGISPTTSTLENPSISISTPNQTIKVILKVCNALGCTETTFNQALTITPEVTSQFSFQSTLNPLEIQFNNQSSYAISSFWDFGDGQFGQTLSPSHIYAGSGNYNVKLTTYSECDTAVSTQTVVLTVGQKDVFESNLIRISPNPTNGICHLDFGQSLKKYSIKCFNSVGKLIFKGENQTTTDFDFSNYPTGVYWFEISAEKERMLKKLIVVR